MAALSSNTVPPSGVPGKKTLSHKIESVQRSAARYVCNNYNYNYTSIVTCMLKSLNRHTLEYRRNHSSLIYFYKIRSALVHVDHHHLIPTRNLNYLIPHSNTQYHSNSYFPRTIRLWNSLPDTVQASPSLAIFATRLAAVLVSIKMCTCYYYFIIIFSQNYTIHLYFYNKCNNLTWASQL